MLKTYFKIAWRNIIRNKAYSALNILGLAIGMAVALLIGLWIKDQSSYDRWLPDYQQASQVRFNYNDNGTTRTQNEVCFPLAAALKNDIPEIAHTAACFGPFQQTLSVGDKKIYPHNLIAGKEFLEIFQFPMLQGSRSLAMQDPGCIVLTESTAKALFGDTDPMNKTVTVSNSYSLKVTGVLKDLPYNSSFRFDFLTSFERFAEWGWVKVAVNNWKDCAFKMYAGLKPYTTYEEVEAKARMLVKKYAPDNYKTSQQQVTLQPLKDWHLYTEFQNGKAAGGAISYIRVFGIIGILVLLIACINFVNLSTARSGKRAREVGVRKVIGSTRRGLILQFMIESLIITCVAFILSVLFVMLALPAFSTLTKNPIGIPWTNGSFWLIMIGYLLLTALLAGSRPAFYLSSFRPAKVLKGAIQTAKSAAFSRKGLVVLQFTCSIGLIIATIVIYQQVQYGKNRPAGYNPNRLVQSAAGLVNYEGLKNAALGSGMVTSMTKSMSKATEVMSHNSIDDWDGKLPNEPLSLVVNAVSDSDYFRTLGMQLKEGRNFTGDLAADSLNVILSVAAVERMRLKDPIGKIITWSAIGAPHRLQIIGVVNDALNQSPFSRPEPAIFIYKPDWTLTYIYRLAPAVTAQQAIATLRPIFETNDPSIVYDYHFVDEEYASKFELETLIGKLAGIFAVLAIFICCLGLFGLTSYVAEQRTKEIGIRKVMGASVAQVLLLLIKEFIIMIMISCALASPIAFYILHNWLLQYYYRIGIGAGVFISSWALAIMIALLIASSQTLKAASMNPVKSLKNE